LSDCYSYSPISSRNPPILLDQALNCTDTSSEYYVFYYLFIQNVKARCKLYWHLSLHPVENNDGQIELNLEVCISNSHVYGTVTLAVTVTVNSGASYLHGNHLALAVRRN
jgi:hypothetical protein